MRLPPERFRPVAIDVSGMATDAYATEMRMTIPTIIAIPDPASVLGNRLRATPQMLRVEADGRVRQVWTGARQIREATV